MDKDDAIESAEAVRAAAWRRRLAVEAALMRRRGRYGGESPRQRAIAAVVTGGLRLTRLYERGLANAAAPVLGERTVYAPLWPSRLDGFRILHVSDFHFDGGFEMAARIGDLLNRVEADLCAYTGDTVFYPETDPGAAGHALAMALAGVRSRLGVFGALGNNDFSWVKGPAEGAGVRWLVNAHTVFTAEGVTLAGVDDPHRFRCAELTAALAGAPPDEPAVLLAHAPGCAAEAARCGVALMLSGHTHGGQLCLPGGYPVFRNGRFPRERVKGLWRFREMAGHTSPGLGCTSVPVRYNCPPEATVLTIRSGR